MTESNIKSRRKKPLLIRILLWSFIGIIVLVIAIYTAFQVSPWPSVLIIRYAFTKEAEKVSESLKKYVPDDVSEILNEQYDLADEDAWLNVYFPSSIENSQRKLSVIVWIHGGAFISGSKEQVANYCKILSSNGYTVVATDYSLAPSKTYPTPVRQTNNALGYLVSNADRFHIDTSKLFLAGDSGGSHIAAQLANCISDPSYAKLLGIEPEIDREQLAGVILYCGPYDTENINLKGSFGFFLNTVLWAYSGTKDFVNSSDFKTASVINYVTAEFPAAFISVGNDDPLATQSYNFSRKLGSLGVTIDTLFYPADYQPDLPHEYQFNLDTDAGKLALKSSLKFLSENTGVLER